MLQKTKEFEYTSTIPTEPGITLTSFTFKVRLIRRKFGQRIARAYRDKVLRETLEYLLRPGPEEAQGSAPKRQHPDGFVGLLKILRKAYPSMHPQDVRRLAHRLVHKARRLAKPV